MIDIQSVVKVKYACLLNWRYISLFKSSIDIHRLRINERMAKCEAVKKGYICLYESQSHLPNVIKQKVNNKVQKVCHKETMKFEWVWNRLLIQRYITQTDPDELIVLFYFAYVFFALTSDSTMNTCMWVYETAKSINIYMFKLNSHLLNTLRQLLPSGNIICVQKWLNSSIYCYCAKVCLFVHECVSVLPIINLKCLHHTYQC